MAIEGCLSVGCCFAFINIEFHVTFYQPEV